MGVARTYLSAVAAGALTAGVAAANVVAVPPDRLYRLSHRRGTSIWPSSRSRSSILDRLPGPLTIRPEARLCEGGMDPLELQASKQEAGNTYDLPGLNTTVDSNSTQHVLVRSAFREPITSTSAGASDQLGQLRFGGNLLGGVLTSSAVVNRRTETSISSRFSAAPRVSARPSTARCRTTDYDAHT